MSDIPKCLSSAISHLYNLSLDVSMRIEYGSLKTKGPRYYCELQQWKQIFIVLVLLPQNVGAHIR